MCKNRLRQKVAWRKMCTSKERQGERRNEGQANEPKNKENEGRKVWVAGEKEEREEEGQEGEGEKISERRRNSRWKEVKKGKY